MGSGWTEGGARTKTAGMTGKRQGTEAAGRGGAREARLKAALKANIARRKAARAESGPEPDEPPEREDRPGQKES